MRDRVEKSGLQVDAALAAFIEGEVLGPQGKNAAAFWSGFAALLERFVPINRALLAKRDELQAQIDAWHVERAGAGIEQAEYQAFLARIGYLVPEPAPFDVGTAAVDPEIATMAGPQLVVPMLNARFLLNAANARWGSLYDAFYGTDALDAAPAVPGGYDEVRGQAVIAAARAFLNEAIPGWEAALSGGTSEHLVAQRPGAYLFRHNGLHIEVQVDPDSPVGRTDPLGIKDVVLESALTTICDLEDSIAAVDAEDKLAAYRNWLGVIRGDLTESFAKGGQTLTRSLNPDRVWDSPLPFRGGAGGGDSPSHATQDGADSPHPNPSPEGEGLRLPGRSLLFVRNVGHLMTNPAILLADGSEVPEGIMDAVVTSAIGALGLAGLGSHANSRTGSIYIVKPKMHGPEECGFTNDLFDAVEDLLGLARHTVKVGVMDEERRTSANLAACIHAVKDRIVFINTGFLDRTGDELHTSMRAGPMLRKGAMKATPWIAAYEARNVQIGLACGLSGKAQIGKGMWAAPDMMADMMVQKGAHPKAGANTAWVPSPTAATLHATHYHQVDVFAVQQELALRPTPGLNDLLTVPLAAGTNWSEAEVREELDNNAQGLLGYVVRWIDAGVGCSKVPDLGDVGLMEDRATLRISSQHMANWLLHGVCSKDQVMDALTRMAVKVDAQNAGDPGYEQLKPDSMAFQAACDLVFKGVEQPSGYTEPLLHAWRQKKKAG